MTFGSPICHDHHYWFSGSGSAKNKLSSYETYSLVKDTGPVSQQFSLEYFKDPICCQLPFSLQLCQHCVL